MYSTGQRHPNYDEHWHPSKLTDLAEIAVHKAAMHRLSEFDPIENRLFHLTMKSILKEVKLGFASHEKLLSMVVRLRVLLEKMTGEPCVHTNELLLTFLLAEPDMGSEFLSETIFYQCTLTASKSKKMGDDCYKNEDYNTAIMHYRAGIGKTNSILSMKMWSKMAECYLRMLNGPKALLCVNKVLLQEQMLANIPKTHYKTLQRRGRALLLQLLEWKRPSHLLTQQSSNTIPQLTCGKLLPPPTCEEVLDGMENFGILDVYNAIVKLDSLQTSILVSSQAYLHKVAPTMKSELDILLSRNKISRVVRSLYETESEADIHKIWCKLEAISGVMEQSHISLKDQLKIEQILNLMYGKMIFDSYWTGVDCKTTEELNDRLSRRRIYLDNINHIDRAESVIVALHAAVLTSWLELTYTVYRACLSVCRTLIIRPKTMIPKEHGPISKLTVSLAKSWEEITRNWTTSLESFPVDESYGLLTPIDIFYIAHHSMLGYAQEQRYIFLSHRGPDTKLDLLSMVYSMIETDKDLANCIFLDALAEADNETCDSFIWHKLGQSLTALLIISTGFDQSLYCKKEREAIKLLHCIGHLKEAITIQVGDNYIDSAKIGISSLYKQYPSRNLVFPIPDLSFDKIPPNIGDLLLNSLTQQTTKLINQIKKLPEKEWDTPISDIHSFSKESMHKTWCAVIHPKLLDHSETNRRYTKEAVVGATMCFCIKTLAKCKVEGCNLNLLHAAQSMVEILGTKMSEDWILLSVLEDTSSLPQSVTTDIAEELFNQIIGKTVEFEKLQRPRYVHWRNEDAPFALASYIWLGSLSPRFLSCRMGENPESLAGQIELGYIPHRPYVDIALDTGNVEGFTFPSLYSHTPWGALGLIRPGGKFYSVGDFVTETFVLSTSHSFVDLMTISIVMHHGWPNNASYYFDVLLNSQRIGSFMFRADLDTLPNFKITKSFTFSPIILSQSVTVLMMCVKIEGERQKKVKKGSWNWYPGGKITFPNLLRN